MQKVALLSERNISARTLFTGVCVKLFFVFYGECPFMLHASLASGCTTSAEELSTNRYHQGSWPSRWVGCSKNFLGQVDQLDTKEKV